jgi:hypothetical protein
MAYLAHYSFVAAALYFLIWATGRLLDRHSRRLGADALERAAAGLVFGFGAWVALIFALASAGLLRAPVVLVTVAVGLAAGLFGLVREKPRLPDDLAQLRVRPAAAIVVVVITVVVGALWMQVLRPIVAWDADVYHLTLPRLYLENGGFYRVPFNVYSNWPLATQMLYALALAVGDQIVAKSLHFGAGLATAALVGALVARESSRHWGLMATAMLFLHPVFLWEIRVAYVDLASAFLLLAAFTFVHRALESRQQETGWLVLAGIAAGLLAGTKINGVFGAAALAAVWLGSSLLDRRAPADLVRPLTALLLPVALLGLPWLVRSYVMTGNPVYPLLWPLFGGPEWSEALATAHGAWTRSMGMGREAVDYLLLLPRVLLAGGPGYQSFDGRLHPLWALLLPLAAVAGRKEPLVRRSLACAGVWFVAWAGTSQQMRFLLPALPLTAVAVGVGMQRGVQRLGSARRTVEPLLAVGLSALIVASSLVYLQQAPSLARAFWSRGSELKAFATDEVYGFVSSELPEDSRLLFVNVNRGFFCDRDFVADSFFEASQLAEWLTAMGDKEGVRRGLRDAGITHVLVQVVAGGPRFPQAFLDLLAEPGQRRVYESPSEARNRFYVVALAG